MFFAFSSTLKQLGHTRKVPSITALTCSKCMCCTAQKRLWRQAY